MKLRWIYEEWVKPDLRSETGELERTATELGIDPQALLQAATAGSLQPLSEQDWANLQNSDSYHTNDLDSARQLATEYVRSIDRIIEGVKAGARLPAPIVLMTETGPYLVAGNTRLMVARAMKMRPLVWVIDPTLAESFIMHKIRDVLASSNFFNRPIVQQDQLYQPVSGHSNPPADKETSNAIGIPKKPRHRRYLGMELRPGTIRL